MRAQLDRTEQRILGVLIEKELTVPETYPLSLNALVLGCNQKSNRDPMFELEEFEVEGALTSLCLKDWAARREGSRVVKFVHRFETKLAVGLAEKAILAELLLRGPQTPAELKTRIGRMGAQMDVDKVSAQLHALAQKSGGALVELLPRQPRERDARWRHLLGPMTKEHSAREEGGGSEPPRAPSQMPNTPQSPLPSPPPIAPNHASNTLERLAALEARVAELERRLDA